MTKLFAFLSIIILLSGGEQKKIIASYSAISCSCAQWKVAGEKENVYLERENEKLQDVNKLWDGETLPFKVEVTGKFKALKGIPKGFAMKSEPKAAKVFVYSKVVVLKK
eukprot:TRINITY_DN11111_c0_g3_i1.p1 TRINITY_DN11111_c0_g3~~TRINITY_DN11111_c0_g3_i1.p1  ORF type:complete len:109 (+),score=18.30 TRINITY_DN11111_c0_g3_i1:382-708(+)